MATAEYNFSTAVQNFLQKDPKVEQAMRDGITTLADKLAGGEFNEETQLSIRNSIFSGILASMNDLYFAGAYVVRTVQTEAQKATEEAQRRKKQQEEELIKCEEVKEEVLKYQGRILYILGAEIPAVQSTIKQCDEKINETFFSPTLSNEDKVAASKDFEAEKNSLKQQLMACEQMCYNILRKRHVLLFSKFFGSPVRLIIPEHDKINNLALLGKDGDETKPRKDNNDVCTLSPSELTYVKTEKGDFDNALKKLNDGIGFDGRKLVIVDLLQTSKRAVTSRKGKSPGKKPKFPNGSKVIVQYEDDIMSAVIKNFVSGKGKGYTVYYTDSSEIEDNVLAKRITLDPSHEEENEPKQKKRKTALPVFTVLPTIQGDPYLGTAKR